MPVGSHETGRTYYVVDAFTSEPFSGNPAAIVLDTDNLQDATMQAIAAEFNVSETTFVIPQQSQGPSVADGKAPDLTLRFRWFSPTVEVRMCGHATVAGIHALVQEGRIRNPVAQDSIVVAIETRSGRLNAFVESIPGQGGRNMIWLDLVDPTIVALAWSDKETRELANLLNSPADAWDGSLPVVRTQDDDVIAFLRDVQTLMDVRPDFDALAAWMRTIGARGLSLATVNTLTPTIHVQSRFFAPTAGINEDPVTGSVHGPLAACLVEFGRVPLADSLAALTCVQGIPGGRTGLLHALVQKQDSGRFAVRIGGRAVTVMRGTLYV